MRRMLLVAALWALALGAELSMVIEYSTNGDVALSIMNITFHTVELEVTLLGCDYGYYPTAGSAEYQCLECACEAFDSVRSEAFA